MEFLRSLLRRRFARTQVATSQDGGCFLRLVRLKVNSIVIEINLRIFFPQLGVHLTYNQLFLASDIYTLNQLHFCSPNRTCSMNAIVCNKKTQLCIILGLDHLQVQYVNPFTPKSAQNENSRQIPKFHFGNSTT